MHNVIPVVNHNMKKVLLVLEKQPQHGFEDCNQILSVNRDQACANGDSTSPSRRIGSEGEIPRIKVMKVSRAASEIVRNHKSIFGMYITLGLCRFTSTNN